MFPWNHCMFPNFWMWFLMSWWMEIMVCLFKQKTSFLCSKWSSSLPSGYQYLNKEKLLTQTVLLQIWCRAMTRRELVCHVDMVTRRIILLYRYWQAGILDSGIFWLIYIDWENWLPYYNMLPWQRKRGPQISLEKIN